MPAGGTAAAAAAAAVLLLLLLGHAAAQPACAWPSAGSSDQDYLLAFKACFQNGNMVLSSW